MTTIQLRPLWRILLLWLTILILPQAYAATDAADNAKAAAGVTQAQRQIEQPYNNAPVWREVRSGNAGFTTVRSNVGETGVLIQSGGDFWRSLRNGPITLYGGILLLVVPMVIMGFYRKWGALKLHDKPTGRMIERFSAWDRLVHWSTAISFCVLGASGLIILFGKHVLLPVLGYYLFSWLAEIAKALHNFVGPLFIFCVLVMFFTFAKDNLWKLHDLQWIRKFGGMFGGGHVPSDRFNAGEKLWFWGGVFFLSIGVAASGLILDFPNFGATRATMQVANIVHVIAAILYIAAFCGHLYMGTIGVEGSYQAMRTGYVDETWAKEHHEYWCHQVQSAKPEHKPAAERAGATV